jgi:N-acetylglutamate synthase-like GNAT family acetyltransferase
LGDRKTKVKKESGMEASLANRSPATLLRWLATTSDAIANAKGLPAERPRKKTEGLWLDLKKAAIPKQTVQTLFLQEVTTQHDWDRMGELRRQVEIPFGVTDPTAVAKLIEQVRRCQKMLKGQWYLAQLLPNGEFIGEVGLVPFEFDGLRIGRVQDVDIVPAFQHRGLGNILLEAISRLAKSEGFSALCLVADMDDWPRHWYQRRGFVSLGEIES